MSDLLVLVGIDRETADLSGVEDEDIEGVFIWGLGAGSN
jgi:hypothetical protein